MKKKPPDRYDFYLGVVIFLIVIFFTAICVVNIARGDESRLEIPKNTIYSYIQGNSVVAHTPAYYIRPYTLGSLGEAIIHCESKGNQNAVGKAGEIGVAQFMPETWEWMCELADYRGDINNEEDQRYLLAWGLDNGYADHWVCFRHIKGR